MKALAALFLALAGAVMAVAAPLPDVPNIIGETEVAAPMPAVKTQGGMAYLNGGASIGEANYMKSRAWEFPLQFIFSGRGGEYGVADQVTFRSGGRELITVRDAGPFLMMTVPPGRYTVEATFKGAVETRTVVVGNGVSKVNWNTLRASE